MTWTLQEIEKWRGYAVEWQDANRVLLSRRNRLFQTAGVDSPLEFIAEVPVPAWQAAAARFRLGQRLQRFMFYNALPLANGRMLVTFGKRVGVIENGKYQDLKNIKRPFRVLRQACAVAPDGSAYFGEYIDNATRGEMTIYRLAPGADAAEIAHTFSAGEIRHIHGVYYDEFTDALWAATGDGDAESRIWRTEDDFKTLEIVGAGDETWRAVSLLFTERAIYYATDAEFRANHIYRLDRATLERRILAEINGPVYYSKAVGADLFFAVTAEIAPAQTENSAVIWHVDARDNVNRIYAAPKDLFSNKKLAMLFMPGTLHFPAGRCDSETFVHAVGLRSIDNRTFRLSFQ